MAQSQQPFFFDEKMLDDPVETDLSDDFPIWLAAERAVTRYEGILSAVGPRKRLLRKFLSWIGLVPSTPEQAFDLNSDSSVSESHLRLCQHFKTELLKFITDVLFLVCLL